MIIWGSRGIRSTVEQQQFYCPQCSAQRPCAVKQVRNFFTLYFIPIIPLDVAGRYIECESCGGTYAEEMLHYDPEEERQETNTQLLRIMIMAAMADGDVDEAELAEIKKQYMEFAGLPVSPDTLHQEIALAREAQTDLNTFAARMAPGLSPHGRALVVKLAFHTMSAAGDLQPGHQTQLAQLGSTLGIPEDQYKELIRHLSESPVDDA